MKLFIIPLFIKLISCTEYLIDVNEYHEPLTTFDKVTHNVKYCIYLNNKTLDINYLTGTWYIIYKFAASVTGIGSEDCETTKFTLPTKEDLDRYKAKYDLRNETFTFDDALLCEKDQSYSPPIKGIVAGNKTAKYYFLDPKSAMRLSTVYEVYTYKPVNNDYMIYYDCQMRGHVKFLMSKKRDQTDEELEKILKPLDELKNYGKQRFCYKRKVASTTPYF